MFSNTPKNIFMNEKLHLISYGDEKYINAKKRIYNEALNTNWFYSVKCYGKEDLSVSFRNEFKTLLSIPRGGGYWAWKFDLILQKLEEINNGEFLIYVDSGCTVNSKGGKRLEEYINMIKNNKNKIISFQMPHKENHYTTKQIFDSFNVPENDPIETSGQFVGGILIMQKCDAVVNLYKDCMNKIKKYPLIITDFYNSKQREYFKDNRHDQSIQSVARKIHGSVVIPDETWSEDFNSETMQKIPFLATRKRISSKENQQNTVNTNKLSDYENIHKGQDIYIIGSGKSLDFLDKSFFENKITIGVNQSYKYIEPQYLVRKEHKFIDLILEETSEHVKHFISFGDCGNRDVSGSLKYQNNKNIVFYNHLVNVENNHDFNSLPEEKNSLVVSHSTITTAIHLAAIMGAKNIILVGHDGGSINNECNFLNYHTNQTMHQSNNNEYKVWLKHISSQTIKLKKLLKDKYNCNVVSINPFINFQLEGNIFTY